jgi:hypothetical protein
MLHKNTTLLKQNMKIFNTEVKVLVPNKKVSWSQYFSYFTSGLLAALRASIFLGSYIRKMGHSTPPYLPPIAVSLLLSTENPRKIPSNPLFPVSPCPIKQR